MRQLPPLAGRFVRVACELLATTAGIVWIDPDSATLAILLAVVTLVVPLASHPILSELELRMRTHAGALSRYYLDALLGLVPIRTHGAERPLRREHGRVMREWLTERRAAAARVGRDRGRADDRSASASPHGCCCRTSPAAATRRRCCCSTGRCACRCSATSSRILAASVPVDPQRDAAAARAAAGADIVSSGRALRCQPSERAAGGVTIVMDRVDVQAAGHPVLRAVTVAIPAGAHVAVVGASGAGKSTLVGLLLGWHTAAAGAGARGRAAPRQRRTSVRCAG